MTSKVTVRERMRGYPLGRRASQEPGAQPDTWRMTLSATCASLVGIGLARFGYTPMLPALIEGGWFSTSAAAFLGAANLAGYLIGVLLAGWLRRRLQPHLLLRGAMLLVAASFFACAWQAGYLWFFGWRLLSGVAGGIVMILAAPTILPHVPPSRHGLVGGAVFMGVGVGIVASGSLIPLLIGVGLQQAWLGLGVLAALLALIGWGGWPHAAMGEQGSHRRRPSQNGARAIGFLAASYALNAFGLVPHMVFLVAFVARGLGQGLAVGTRYWVFFGMGAAVGPVMLGHLADRIGARRAFRVLLGLEVVFVALPAISSGIVALIASSLVVGACTIGVAPVVLARTRELLRHHPAAQPGAWRQATTSFALLQAAGAYILSFVFARTGGNYPLLFAIGAAAMAVALVVDWLAAHEEMAP